MEIEKFKVSIQFLLIFRQSGDVLFFLYARRLRGYTATESRELFLYQQIVNSTFRLVASMFYVVLSLPIKLPRSQSLPREPLREESR